VGEQSCELPLSNASEREIDEILSDARTIAVVGLSKKPDRESHMVARYLQANGYRIFPVNPGVAEVLGERSYPDLASLPAEIAIDVVDIFRKPEFIPAIVDAAIARGARAVWMQLGLVQNAAAERARAAGLGVVMDRCMKVEHARWSTRKGLEA
jgi:predicted CoA-binding protein